MVWVRAWRRSLYLLWEKRSWKRWISLGVLAGAAAATMMSPPVTPSDLSRMGWQPGAVALSMGLFSVITLGLGFVCAVARFVMLEDLVFDRHEVLEPGFRFGKPGRQLFGLQLCVFALSLLAGALTGPSSSLLRNLDLAVLLQGLGIWFALRCASVFLDEILAPIMYCGQCGPGPAMARVLAFTSRRPAGVLGWALGRFFLGIGCGIAFVGVAGACMLGTWMLLCLLAFPLMLLLHPETGSPVAVGLMMVTGGLACAALLPQILVLSVPGIVLLRVFSIYSLQSLDEELEMLPLSGRGTIDDGLGELESGTDPQPAGNAEAGQSALLSAPV